MDGKDFVKESLSFSNGIPIASMCVFRKDSYLDSRNLDKYTFCGDWYLWIHISCQGKVKISGKCLNYFRKHQSDVSGKKLNDGTFHREYIEIQKMLLDRKFINKESYERNLLLIYKTINSLVRPELKAQVKLQYKKLLGWKVYYNYLRMILYSKIKLIIKIFSFEY
jgi:hypothetical protein